MSVARNRKAPSGWCPGEWLPRLLVAALFAYTGATKIMDPETFIKAVKFYQMVPPAMTHLVAFILPWLELLAAVFLVGGLWRREARLLIAGMLLVFSLAKGYLLAKGVDFEGCGCVSADSFLYVLFKGWIGVATNLVCLLMLAVEGGFEYRRWRNARSPREEPPGEQAVPV
ncbi:MAG: MauE/DoxX family redox-associated membrane protein [Planctomycetota bacterium]